MTVMVGDCRETLQTLADNSVDSIVTDPPYEIGFMGKGWDGSGVANDPKLWAECYRVLKPGGHLLAFGATRTYHRMACAIEDAGFEIRDSIHWVYGSGFPKSHNVSKGIDRKRDDRAEVLEVTGWIRENAKAAGITRTQIDGAFGFAGMASHWMSVKSQPTVPTLEQVPTLLEVLGHTVETIPERIGHLLLELNGRKGQPGAAWYDRQVIGTNNKTTLAVAPGENRDRPPTVLDITAAATDDAKRWEGWGTALKPAHEPIVMARKPFAGTVAANVMEYGTGALNIDGTRVGANGGTAKGTFPKGASNGIYGDGINGACEIVNLAAGRWPANIILTHSTECGLECAPDCPALEIDQQAETASRYFAQPEWSPADYLASVYTPKAGKKERNAGLDGMPYTQSPTMGKGIGGNAKDPDYIMGPKQNHHPTVKPVALMRYLIRIVTPPGGTVLDPFLGSGTTAVAAILEGFEWIGCELTAEYLPIIEGRTANAKRDYSAINTIQNSDNTTQTQMGLFDRTNK